MPFCVNEVSVVYAGVAICGILVLLYIQVRPQARRQATLEEKFRKRMIRQYERDNHARLREEYAGFVAQGYPNVREQDRTTYTAEYFSSLSATTAVLNKLLEGQVRYPMVRLTDARCAALGAGLAVVGVLLASLLPAC